MTPVQKIEDHICNMAKYCQDIVELSASRRNEGTIQLQYRPWSDEPVYQYSSAFYGHSKSNHQKMSDAQVKDKLARDMHSLRALIAEAVPALANDHLSFGLEFRKMSKTGQPRLKFDLCHHQFAGNPVTLKTIMKRIDALIRHTKSVPASTAHEYEVNASRIFARDAYDAVRIYAALSMPFDLDTQPATYPKLKVMEVLDAQPYCQALFSPSD